MGKWTTADMPGQQGRVAVVTGTGGLGFETALALARAGAETIIAGRNPGKGADAVREILAKHPTAKVRFEMLDLANLASIGDFAARLRDRHDKLDLLVNNAGVMVPPVRQQTADGFELQFGTNHLGHFALTGRLLPLLRKGQDARVISLSSVAARNRVINLDDLNTKKSYKPMTAYSQSKLACLMFGLELQRRSEAAGWGITSIIAHPGVARTDLLHNAPGRWSGIGITRSLLWFLFQPAAQGALPTLFAATAHDAKPAGYYGPDAFSETRGYPAPAKVPPAAQDEAIVRRLWETSDVLVRGFEG
ncbi:SDR family oxidoreductase [Sphingobium phenoxybenzoativorans]|uniref:SDR family oxidoreductase n=1 Tax=Sphingobium phenoxybenzoativorans TaxID=1592790 RepID=A0A975K5B0_9SPHN|nr:SDR family oxidoreductase [Sphingobium phenoxybenzoativorans]QUT05085.1 SDR family oxidoreductase [Sphingobium phenoxybenzoativorans]